MRLTERSPDPWQAWILRNHFGRLLINASRQSGKSHLGAALALREALVNPPALVLIVCPAERQSKELFQEKFLWLYDKLPETVPLIERTVLTCRFANGSRVVALPGKEGTIRSFSAVRLLLLDEAARVVDPLYEAVRPMLSVSRGSLVAMSTPWGKRGWWHNSWDNHEERWTRVKVPATMCPRIPVEFLEGERAALGDRVYRQEYGCEFTSTIGACFAEEQIQGLFSEEVQPLFGVGS